METCHLSFQKEGPIVTFCSVGFNQRRNEETRIRFTDPFGSRQATNSLGHASFHWPPFSTVSWPGRPRGGVRTGERDTRKEESVFFFNGLVAKGKPNHKDQERPVHGPKLSGPLAMPEVGSPKGHRHLKGDWVRIYFGLLFSRFILEIPLQRDFSLGRRAPFQRPEVQLEHLLVRGG